LFTPSSGVPPFTQVHDLNGGISPNDLFWTVALPPGSFSMTGNGKQAHLHARGVPLIESYALFGTPSPLGTVSNPATVDLEVDWRATGPAVPRGSGPAGPPAEAFLGSFAPARATGTFSGSELGFEFTTNGRASSDGAYAEIGSERNGSFL
jgi:hypothetical protein